MISELLLTTGFQFQIWFLVTLQKALDRSDYSVACLKLKNK